MYETKEIKLPSNGYMGVSKVTIRNMTGADEKIIYSGVSETAVDKLLKRCIVEPADIVVSDLCEQDKYYIMMQIRILTFGSDYSFVTTCPDCKSKIQVDIDLDDLEVFYADEKFDEGLKYELPCGDIVEFKILTSKDVNEVNTLIGKLKANNDKGTQMILRLASVISTLNGEKKSLVEKQKYLEEASSRDLNKLWKAYSKIKLGVNMNTLISCSACGMVNEVGVVMNTEFFRPSFDD